MKNLSIIFLPCFLLLSFTTTASVFAQDLDAGLVGYYKMDEGEGAFTANSATGDNIAPDGILFNDPVWGEGVYGSGLWFVRTESYYVWLDTFDPAAETGAMTISVWTNWQGLSTGWHGICGKRDGWEPEQIKWSMVLDINTGGVQFETNTADGKVFIITPQAPTIGAWQHIAVTFDGAWAIFYMDGVMVSEGPMVFGLNDFASLHFGCGTANGRDAFSGGLDELRFYNRVLTPEEVYILATEDPGTSVNGPPTALVKDYALHQNYPNPFNPSTTIRYDLPKSGFVTVKIYNTLGDEVHSLVNAIQTSGNHSITFDAGDLAGGVYLYALKVGGRFVESRKMIFLK